jgi:hypothetical protein
MPDLIKLDSINQTLFMGFIKTYDFVYAMSMTISTQHRSAAIRRETHQPTAKIHVHENQYDGQRPARLGDAIQGALEAVLKTPPDYYRIIHALPRGSFVHTLSFLGLHYSYALSVLEITFIAGRPKETRLALLKELNKRVVAETGISPDDPMILLYELPGENISFGRGLAQRAHIPAQS